MRGTSGYQVEDLYLVSPINRAVITNLIPAREVIHVLVCDEMEPELFEEVAKAADGVFKRKQKQSEEAPQQHAQGSEAPRP